jgi:hypothetical protein
MLEELGKISIFTVLESFQSICMKRFTLLRNKTQWYCEDNRFEKETHGRNSPLISLDAFTYAYREKRPISVDARYKA